MNKKAELTTAEMIELLLAVAVVVVIVLLVSKMLFPPNLDKETAKSFFDTLKQSLAEADKQGTSEFSLWGNEKVYVIYFKDNHLYDYTEMRYLAVFGVTTWFKVPKLKMLFKANHNYQNAICSCYLNGKTIEYNGISGYQEGVCPYCMNLNYPIISYSIMDDKGSKLDANALNQIFIESGAKLIILKNQQGYSLTKQLK